MALDYCGEDLVVESEDEDSVTAAVCARHYEKVLRRVLESRPWPWATRRAPLSELDDVAATTLYADAASPYDNFLIPGAYQSTDQIEVVHIDASAVETTLTADTDYTVDDGGRTLTLGTPLSVDESLQITISYSRVGWEHLYSLPSDCVTPGAIIVAGKRQMLVAAADRVPHEIMVNDGGDGRLLACDTAVDDIDALEYTALVTDTTVFSGHFIEAVAWGLAACVSPARRKDPNHTEYCRKRFEAALAEAGAYERNIGHDSEPDTSSIAARS